MIENKDKEMYFIKEGNHLPPYTAKVLSKVAEDCCNVGIKPYAIRMMEPAKM